ncbi:MAG TPA: DUF6311 domain-containing protein [Acetobacteraceae bacterium]
MTTRILPAPFVTYACAALIGVVAALLVLPAETILGSGPGWEVPFTDQARSLTGHLAYQADAWRWPPLWTDALFWPRGMSVALTDSNPLVSIPTKLWTRLTGAAPVNLLGAWLALCWVAQPVAAAYAARGLRLGTVPCLAAGVLAACWPALLMRMGHVNLCGHFLILLALGLALRRLPICEGPSCGGPGSGGRLAPALLLLAAVLVHPYLFEIVAVVLAAVPLQAALDRRPGWRRGAAGYLAACAGAVAALALLSGPLGGGDKGFVTYSMNLLSPVWPQRSGVFGADLPVLDATGGQAEGFNWLGAGVLLLGVAALAGLVRRRPAVRPVRGLLLVLGGLALLSLSSRVYAGPFKVLDLGAKPWEDIFGTFRAPGRAFWPVGYALMLAAVAGVARLPRPWGAMLLVAACALQVVDSEPLRRSARQGWEHGANVAVLPVPEETRLFGVAPYPTCSADRVAQAEAEVMLLHAVQAGARLRDVGAGRPPPSFNCEKTLAELTELPLLPGEARAYFGDGTRAALRPEWLGPDTVCRALPQAVLCGRGVAPFAGMPFAGAPGAGSPGAAGPAADPLALPLTLMGSALAPVLGSGWRWDGDGQAWSEGPHSTLMLDVPAGPDAVLTLHVQGIAAQSGGTRGVDVNMRAPDTGDANGTTFHVALPDGAATNVVLRLPAHQAEWVRVALDAPRPLDPARRAMTAPVHRAAVKLLGIDLRAGDDRPPL